MTECGFSQLSFLEWWWEEECPQQTHSSTAVCFSGDQQVCGVTAFAVPGLSAQHVPRKKSKEHALIRFLVWDTAIINQLTEPCSQLF